MRAPLSPRHDCVRLGVPRVPLRALPDERNLVAAVLGRKAITTTRRSNESHVIDCVLGGHGLIMPNTMLCASRYPHLRDDVRQMARA